MKTRILTAVVIGILGIGVSGVAGAQSRYRPTTTPTSGRTGSQASVNASAARSPLSRDPVARNSTAGRPSTESLRRQADSNRSPSLARQQSRGRFGIMAPVMPARDTRFMNTAVTRLVRGRTGSVSAPRNSTPASMRAILKGAWDKMMTGGRDVRMLEVNGPRGTLRTYWVNMNRTTGQVRYPPNVRGISRTFQHVVIQYRVAQSGNETLRIFEPGEAAPADAVEVPRRVY